MLTYFYTYNIIRNPPWKVDESLTLNNRYSSILFWLKVRSISDPFSSVPPFIWTSRSTLYLIFTSLGNKEIGRTQNN